MNTATTVVPARQITDDDVAYMKSFIGQSAVVVQWNEEASTDSIRHYAGGGLGGMRTHCGCRIRTRRQRVTARGSHPLHSFTPCATPKLRWECQRASKLYTWVPTSTSAGRSAWVSVSVPEPSSKMFVNVWAAAPAAWWSRWGRTDYFVGEELVGIVRNTIVCVARSSEGQRMHEPRDPHVYTDEEKEQIRAAILAEEIRGQRTRFAETVSVGDVLPQVVKGPLDLITMTAYYAGGAIGTAGYRGVETRVRQQERVRNGGPKRANKPGF